MLLSALSSSSSSTKSSSTGSRMSCLTPFSSILYFYSLFPFSLELAVSSCSSISASDALCSSKNTLNCLCSQLTTGKYKTMFSFFFLRQRLVHLLRCDLLTSWTGFSFLCRATSSAMIPSSSASSSNVCLILGGKEITFFNMFSESTTIQWIMRRNHCISFHILFNHKKCCIRKQWFWKSWGDTHMGISCCLIKSQRM